MILQQSWFLDLFEKGQKPEEPKEKDKLIFSSKSSICGTFHCAVSSILVVSLDTEAMLL